jgi:hypothetical protein
MRLLENLVPLELRLAKLQRNLLLRLVSRLQLLPH